MPLLIIPETLCNKPSSYVCKWSFIVQAGAGLWAKYTGEPRAYSTSAVLPLPFVNMDPSKLSTMYTCIMLAAEQRKKCGWYYITITFDLPLAKKREMVLAEGQLTLLSGASIRLGGFHYLLLSWVRSVPLWPEMVPMPLAYICTSIHHLNETILCKEQCCSHDTWWMVVHVLKAPAYIYYQREHWQHYYRSRPL